MPIVCANNFERSQKESEVVEPVIFYSHLDGIPSTERIFINGREFRFLAGRLVVSDPEVIAVLRKMVAGGANYTEDEQAFRRDTAASKPVTKTEVEVKRTEKMIFGKALKGQPSKPTPEDLVKASDRNRQVELARQQFAHPPRTGE